MSTIFLSYARGDDEPFVRRLYEDLTAHGFKVWFDRVRMPSRNLTFHQEIRDAVATHNRLLLVVGPKAVASEYVRQEWQFAWFEAEKVVTPILRLGDYPLAIDELKLVHAEDFRNNADYALHLKELVRILTEPPPPLAKLIAVPSLPAHYLSRTDRLIPLRDAVRSGLDSPAPFGGMTAREQFHGIAGAAKHVGMHGMGGIGKSVLANLLAHDRKIREAFPDGIVWVGLGSMPVVEDLMRRVHVDIGGDGAFVTEDEGKAQLKELLSDKMVLLVLDDAWRRQDIEAFDILGPRCRALITTRDVGLLTSVGGTQHLVELLTDDEALRLLALSVGKELDELPAQARTVIKQCGRLPLAVSLAGGMMAGGMQWSQLLAAFGQHRLEFFEDEHRPEQHQSLWKMIEISVRALPAAEQMRLVELGVFPEDEAVPEPAVATLWHHTGELDALDTPKLLAKLKQRSLVQLTSRDDADKLVYSVSLHDLIYDYCLCRAQIELGTLNLLHDRLLAAYARKCPRGWQSGPNDGYFFQNLIHHFALAHQWDNCVHFLGDEGFVGQCYGLASMDRLLRDAELARRMLASAPGDGAARVGQQVRLILEAEAIVETAKSLPLVVSANGDDELFNLPANRIHDILVRRLREFQAKEMTDDDRRRFVSLLRRYAQANDELVAAAVYVLAPGDVVEGWELACGIRDNSRRGLALAHCLEHGSVPVERITKEIERITNEYIRGPILVHAARHLTAMGGTRFCAWIDTLFNTEGEIPALVEFFRHLSAEDRPGRAAILDHLLDLAGMYSLSRSRRDAVHTGLLLSRSFDEHSRRDYFARIADVCERVGDDGNDTRSWTWFHLAVEWAALDVRCAVETVCRGAFANPVACGLAVAARHCDSRPSAISLLARAAWLLPECRPALRIHGGDLPAWPFLVRDPLVADFVHPAESHRDKRKHVAALLCAEFARWGQGETAARLRSIAASAFGEPFAALSLEQWGLLGRAGLEARPDLSPVSVARDYLPFFSRRYWMDPPNEAMSPPRILADEPETHQTEESGDAFQAAWVAARSAERQRIQDARSKSRSLSPSRPEAAPKNPGPPLSAAEAQAVIEDLPNRLANCRLSGRGFRDDFVLEQLDPVFRAWRHMNVEEVTPQADRVVQLLPKLWSGKRHGFPGHVVSAAAAVDVNLGVRILHAAQPSKAQNYAAVYATRLAACGSGDLLEVLNLTGRLLDRGEKVDAVVKHVARLLTECTPKQELALHPVLLRAVAGMSAGFDLTHTLRSVAESLRAMPGKKATELVGDFFRVMASARITPEADGCAELLDAVVADCSAEQLAWLLADYPGPAVVFAELLTRLPADVAEQVAQILAKWGD